MAGNLDGGRLSGRCHKSDRIALPVHVDEVGTGDVQHVVEKTKHLKYICKVNIKLN